MKSNTPSEGVNLDVNTLLRRQMELHTSIRHPPKTSEQLVQLRDTLHNYDYFFTTTLPSIADQLNSNSVTVFQCLMYISNGGAVSFDRQHQDGAVPMHQAKVLSRNGAMELETRVREFITPSELMVYAGISKDIRNTLRVKVEDENDLHTAAHTIREAVEYLDYIYAHAKKNKEAMFAFYMVEDESSLRRLLSCNTAESVEVALIENTWRGLNAEQALSNARAEANEINYMTNNNYNFNNNTNQLLTPETTEQRKYNDKVHLNSNDILDFVNGTDINELIRIDESSNDSTGTSSALRTTQGRMNVDMSQVNKLPSLPRPLTLLMEEVATKCELISSSQTQPLMRTEAAHVLIHWIKEMEEDEFAQFAHELTSTMADAVTLLVSEKRSALCRVGCDLIGVLIRRLSTLAEFMAEVEQGSSVTYNLQPTLLTSSRLSKRHSSLFSNTSLTPAMASPLANAKSSTSYGLVLSRWTGSLVKGVYVTIAAIATSTDRALRDLVIYSHGAYSIVRTILSALENGTQTELRRRCLGYLALGVVSATRPLREIMNHDMNSSSQYNARRAASVRNVSDNNTTIITDEDDNHNYSTNDYLYNHSTRERNRHGESVHRRRSQHYRLQEPFIRRTITRIQHLITLIHPVARQNVEVGDSPNRKMARALCVVLRESYKYINVTVKSSLSVAQNHNMPDANNEIESHCIHGSGVVFEPMSSKTEKLMLQESELVMSVMDDPHALDLLLFERHDFISSTRLSYSPNNNSYNNINGNNGSSNRIKTNENDMMLSSSFRNNNSDICLNKKYVSSSSSSPSPSSPPLLSSSSMLSSSPSPSSLPLSETLTRRVKNKVALQTSKKDEVNKTNVNVSAKCEEEEPNMENQIASSLSLSAELAHILSAPLNYNNTAGNDNLFNNTNSNKTGDNDNNKNIKTEYINVDNRPTIDVCGKKNYSEKNSMINSISDEYKELLREINEELPESDTMTMKRTSNLTELSSPVQQKELSSFISQHRQPTSHNKQTRHVCKSNGNTYNNTERCINTNNINNTYKTIGGSSGNSSSNDDKIDTLHLIRNAQMLMSPSLRKKIANCHYAHTMTK